MKFYGRAESVANRILEQLQTSNIPRALAQVFIKRKDEVPCRSWSWLNQMLTALAGHDDARSLRVGEPCPGISPTYGPIDDVSGGRVRLLASVIPH